ncbi:MAG TPA: hypothetical protein VMS21_14480, partial [Methylomirabilota bacterium]|nr:hypothetical protein [Methylomirabilota bacterium]
GDNTIATARNTRGMLTAVWDLSGEEHTSYDARGRVEWVVKRIPDPVFWTHRAMSISPSWLVSYRTAFEYDSMDRSTRLTYPDLDQITYEYNERGVLKRIPGGPNGNLLSDLAYLPSGQRTRVAYGNGVRTTYNYDPRLRLSALDTRHPTLDTRHSPRPFHLRFRRRLQHPRHPRPTARVCRSR